MEIEVKILPPLERLSIDYIHNFFSDPDILEGLPDDQRTGAFIYSFLVEFNGGKQICMIPLEGTVPLGMFWAERIKEGILEMHQGIFKRHRRLSLAAARAIIEVAENMPGIELIIGFTPHCLRGAKGTALRAGMTERGTIRNYYTINGKREDVWIMAKETKLLMGDA